MSSPTYKTGKYSKYLPVRLVDRYENATADSTLLELREEIGLLDARITDILERVDSGEAGSLWREAHNAFDAFTLAYKQKDEKATSAAFATLSAVLGRGVSDYAAWGELKDTIELRRRLVESERKRQIEMQLSLTIEEAYELYKNLALVVRTYVTDPTVLRKIASEFERLTEKSNNILA